MNLDHACSFNLDMINSHIALYCLNFQMYNGAFKPDYLYVYMHSVFEIPSFEEHF